MLSGIYAIFSKDYTTVYIGSSLNITKRKKRHFNDLKKGIHHNAYLQNYFNKYKENECLFFLALEIIDTPNNDTLIDAEEFFIKF